MFVSVMVVHRVYLQQLVLGYIEAAVLMNIAIYFVMILSKIDIDFIKSKKPPFK